MASPVREEEEKDQMKNSVKFKRLTPSQFNKRYPDAMPCIDGNFVGEVQIPGHGWHACILAGAKGVPIRFYDDDDGWNPVPKVDFEEV
jgi:hypothetical protein